MKPTRLWIQYSLRSFLVLMTALAVWLGVVVHRAREQREAVEAIKALGGVIRYDYELGYSPVRRDGVFWFDYTKQKPPGPAWLRRLVGDEYFQEVWIVGFDRISTSSEIRKSIPYLARLRGLQSVEINSTVSFDMLDEMRAALPDCEVKN